MRMFSNVSDLAFAAKHTLLEKKYDSNYSGLHHFADTTVAPPSVRPNFALFGLWHTAVRQELAPHVILRYTTQTCSPMVHYLA